MERSLTTTIRYHAKLTLLVCILTIFDYIVFVAIDKFMIRHIDGYMSVESYAKSVTIFFFAAYIIHHLGLQYGWQKMYPYLVAATAIFFPLIFIATMVTFLTGLPTDVHQYYAKHYCDGDVASLLCGPALAHVVFNGTMRALPLLVLIPGLFYILFKINFVNIQGKHDAK